MKLEQLHHLVEIHNTKSISSAAERLFISQPALSSSISKLEKELGVTLIKRTNKGVYPTPIGKEVIEKSTQILNIVKDIQVRTEEYSSTLNGKIVISAIPITFAPILYPVYRHYEEKYPNVDLTIKENNPEEVINLVMSGEADFGVICVPPDAPVINNLQYETLLSDKSVCFVGKNHPLAHKKSLTFEEAVKYPIIMIYLEIFGEKPGDNVMPLQLYEKDNIKKLITQGNVISIFPRFTVINDMYINKGEILMLPISQNNPSVVVALVYLKKHRFTKAEKEFCKVIKEVCTQILHKLQ